MEQVNLREAYTNPRRQRKSFSIIPNPFASDREAQRFEHLDLASLSERQIWAEKQIVDLQLARLIAYGRPRLIFCVDDFVHDQEWLEERSRRLQTELRRRKGQR